MKKKVLIIGILLILITTVLTVSVIAFGLKNDKDGYSTLSSNGELVDVKLSDVEKGFSKSSRLLRKDLDTVIAEVNGEKITVNDLNLKRTILVMTSGEPLRDFSEKEVLDALITDSVICDFAESKGYIYEQSNAGKEYKESSTDQAQKGGSEASNKYGEISGLGKKKFSELEFMYSKQAQTYSEFQSFISDDIINDNLGLTDTRSREIYREFDKISQTATSMEDMDLNKISGYMVELTNAYIQKLVDEADVVIYEDKLN